MRIRMAVRATTVILLLSLAGTSGAAMNRVDTSHYNDPHDQAICRLPWWAAKTTMRDIRVRRPAALGSRIADSALEDCQVQVSLTATIPAIPWRSPWRGSEGCDRLARRTGSCWQDGGDGLTNEPLPYQL